MAPIRTTIEYDRKITTASVCRVEVIKVSTGVTGIFE